MTRAAGALLLVRHAESEWNAAGRWQGQSDPALSPRGLAQARTLAVALAEVRLEAIVASDLRRARDTAAVLAETRGLALRVDARLRERDLGAWSGLTTAEIASRWPEDLARLRAHDPDLRPGGGESVRDVAGRVEEALAELSGSGRGRIAIFTHAGVLRALGVVPAPGNAGYRSASLGAVRAALAAVGRPAAARTEGRADGPGDEERL